MTKAYQQMSALDALYTAARKYPGSVEALAARLGKSPNVLRSKLQPDIDTHHITLEEALQIIELLDATVPSAADLAAKAIGWRLGRVMVRHSGTDSDDSAIELQALTVTAAGGLLAANLAISIARSGSQAIAPKDADAISAAIAQALDALFLLKDSIDHLTTKTPANKP